LLFPLLPFSFCFFQHQWISFVQSVFNTIWRLTRYNTDSTESTESTNSSPDGFGFVASDYFITVLDNMRDNDFQTWSKLSPFSSVCSRQQLQVVKKALSSLEEVYLSST
jgi:hypothetical protein